MSETGTASGAQAAGRPRPQPAELILWVLLVAEFVVLYWRAGKELYINWTLIDSYYSHGPLVPLISLFFIWRQRRDILRAPRSSSLWGFAWMGGAALLLLFGDFLGFRVFGHISILPMLVGVLLLVQGPDRVKKMWFPLAFLFFMIPIPPSLTQSIALRLKLVATGWSVWLANRFTLPVVQEGSTIFFPRGEQLDHLLVGDVCGGLRSLIALLALGAVMAYISNTRNWARILILVLSGPIAIVSNVFRIFLLCVVGYFWGSEVAAGRVHDVSGYLIFVVALALFFILETLLRRVASAAKAECSQADDTDVQAETKPRAFKPRLKHGVMVVLLALVAAAHLAILGAQARAAQRSNEMVTLDIPSRIGGYRQIGREHEVDERTQQVLGTSVILIRSYVSPQNRPMSLTIVYAGATRRSLHFPEVCLVGDGWEIQNQEMARVGMLFDAKRLVLVRADQREAVLYWFKTGDTLTGNYFKNAYYWAKNQLMFGAPTSSMIRLSTPIGRDGPESAFRALEDFAITFAPILLDRVD